MPLISPERRTSPPRIVLHAINGVGLGHLVRARCLADELRALGAEILVVTNARDTTLLDGLDWVALPPRLNEPHADPTRARTSLPEPHEEAAILAAIEAFSPHLVVFDTHAPMRVVSALRCRSVLVFREQRPEPTAAFAASGAPTFFDRVLVPHDPMPLPFPATFVGAIVRPLPRSKRSSGVLAMAGGGGQPVDASRYVQAVADAHWLARAKIPTLRTTLVVGPYGQPPKSRYPGLTVLRAPSDLDRRLARAALVISQAGYNAVAELRSLAKPAILVPGHRKAEDQKLRAKRLAKLGAAVVAKPEARSIADRVETLLADGAALDRMRAAHATAPLVAQNRGAALAAVRSVWRPAGPPKDILIVAHDYPPKIGGMETVAASLARTLRAADLRVRVLTAARVGTKDATPLFRPLPPPGRIDAKRDLLLTIDEALRDPPDVVHLCHAGLAPWVPALRAAVPCAVSVNVHGNDLLAPWVDYGDLPDPATRTVAGLRAADAVFAVSEFSRRLARARGVEHALTIENGIDVGRFEPALSPAPPVVLTVSRLAPRKGHRTVIHALAKLGREVTYAFTGESDTLAGELVALGRELGVRVRPLGFVPDEALPALYRSARIFALLAESDDRDVEGFGVAVLEAAASGLPIVAAASGGVPEAVGDAGLLVPPGDVDGAAAAIARLLDDPELARMLGERARRRVRERYTTEHVAARMIAVWTRALAEDRFADPDPTLLREAHGFAAERAAERERRRERLRRVAEGGTPVRLRATREGARLLPEALEDCAAIGVRPIVATKLRRFVDPAFVADALPGVAEVELVHGIPHATSFAAIAALPDAARAKVRSLRLFLEEGASIGEAVLEAHAYRTLLAASGVVVVPPPDIMRYLSEVPAPLPPTAMIEPTNLCNLACPTCPTGTGKIPPRPPMTLDRFDRVLAEIPGLRNVALWNYGEPLLHRQLPELIARAKRAGVGVVKVSSNVHFLDGERGRALLASGLDVLILSVDGASPETYTAFRKDGDFDRVARTVAWLAEERRRLGLTKPRIELQFIVMRHNEHELPKMRELAHAWGVDALRLKTVGAEDADVKHLVPATRLLSRYEADGKTPKVRHPLCTMPWDHTVVNVDGSVTPCCYLRPDMGDAFVMGNVFDQPFVEIWRGERYRAFRARMLAGREAMPVCGQCRGSTQDLVAAVEEVGA